MSKQDHTSATALRRLDPSSSPPMAFVHPSRMALVPKDSRSLPSSGTRLPSPPASPPRDRSVGRYQRRGRDEEYNGDRERRGRGDRSRDYTDRDDERRRDRGRSSDRDQDRHRSHHRSNGDRYDDRRNENRDSDSRGPRSQRDDRSSVRSPPPSSKPPLGRSSPTYDDYSRRHSAPSPPPPSGRSGAPPENAPPWHQQENMYRRDGRLDGGGDYFERHVALCIRRRETLIFFFPGAGNSVSIVLSVSGHRLLVLPHGICAYSLCSSSCIIFNQLPIGRLSETEKHAKGINVFVPLLFHLQRQIAKRNGDVVKEKTASECGKKRTGESGDLDVHKVLRMMTSVSVIVIVGRDAVGQEAENVAKLGREPQAHAAPSQVMKMSGWKNLRPQAPLSPLFPLLCRP